jgi:hypothetical protein
LCFLFCFPSTPTFLQITIKGILISLGPSNVSPKMLYYFWKKLKIFYIASSLLMSIKSWIVAPFGAN